VKIAQDKAKDDKHFNCSEEHELKYISGLYKDETKVYEFFKNLGENDSVKYSTHDKVYNVIKEELGYSIPS